MKKTINYDELLEKIPNKYILTTVAGKRARELQTGEESLVKSLKKDTIVQKVLREIVNDKIGYDIHEDLGE